MDHRQNSIKKRNLWFMLLMMIITFGFYFWYWKYKTKQDINRLGGQIPTFWFAILPFANIFFDYRYARNFVRLILDKDDIALAIVYCIVLLCFPPICAFIIQSQLNRYKK